MSELELSATCCRAKVQGRKFQVSKLRLLLQPRPHRIVDVVQALIQDFLSTSCCQMCLHICFCLGVLPRAANQSLERLPRRLIGFVLSFNASFQTVLMNLDLEVSPFLQLSAVEHPLLALKMLHHDENQHLYLQNGFQQDTSSPGLRALVQAQLRRLRVHSSHEDVAPVEKHVQHLAVCREFSDVARGPRCRGHQWSLLTCRVPDKLPDQVEETSSRLKLSQHDIDLLSSSPRRRLDQSQQAQLGDSLDLQVVSASLAPQVVHTSVLEINAIEAHVILMYFTRDEVLHTHLHDVERVLAEPYPRIVWHSLTLQLHRSQVPDAILCQANLAQESFCMGFANAGNTHARDGTRQEAQSML
mmetsp:Transcript_53475/g.174015  ORF Transcript_53475/g.174015 Transcript_53475/m.174015 type:complete len:358 (-) Transcript_53475:13-1086(-)